MVNEYLKELYYTDYCNNCKDLDVMDSKEVPCSHPFYCWKDGGEVQELEYQLGLIRHNSWLRGYMLASERELLYKLKDKKFGLVKQKLKEYRKNNR